METLSPMVTRDELAAYARESFVRCSLELASRYDAVRVLSLTDPRCAREGPPEPADKRYGVHFFIERRALPRSGAPGFNEFWRVAWRELCVSAGSTGSCARMLHVRRGSSEWAWSAWDLLEPFVGVVCGAYVEQRAILDARGVLTIFASKFAQCDPVYARHATRLLIEARAAPLLADLGLPESLEGLAELFDSRGSPRVRERAVVRHALLRDDRALACFCAFAAVVSGEPLFKGSGLDALRVAVSRLERVVSALR
jgi:hypothetical protein